MKKFTVLTGFLLTSLLMGSLSKASGRAYYEYLRAEKAIWEAGRKAEQSIEQQRQQIVGDAEERAQALLLLIKAGAIQDLSGNEKAPDLNQKPAAAEQKSEK